MTDVVDLINDHRAIEESGVLPVMRPTPGLIGALGMPTGQDVPLWTGPQSEENVQDES